MDITVWEESYARVGPLGGTTKAGKVVPLDDVDLGVSTNPEVGELEHSALSAKLIYSFRTGKPNAKFDAVPRGIRVNPHNPSRLSTGLDVQSTELGLKRAICRSLGFSCWVICT